MWRNQYDASMVDQSDVIVRTNNVRQKPCYGVRGLTHIIEHRAQHPHTYILLIDVSVFFLCSLSILLTIRWTYRSG